MIELVSENASVNGVAPTCRAIELSRATYYRRRHPRPAAQVKPRRVPRALGEPERQEVLDVLHEDRFVDLPPAQVYAALLDDERYLCSERTMYRILQAQGTVTRDRY